MRTPEKFTVGLTGALLCCGSLLAGPLEDLLPGHWYEIPNSKINTPSVRPNPLPPGNFENLIKGYSGGAYDKTRDRLLVWGGGHGDYSGNEIYAFDLNTPSWEKVWGPSLNIPSIPDPSDSPIANDMTYADGNPRSRHSYDGLEYLPVQDAFWFMGGSVWWGGGAGRDTWMFPFSGSNAGTWVKKQDVQHPSYAELQAISDFDPMTGHVFLNSQTWPLQEYDPAANTWKTRGEAVFHTGGMTAAVDPGRRKYVAIGRGKAYAYSLPVSGTAVLEALITTGDKAIENEEGPGFVYYPDKKNLITGEKDPLSDKFVAWSGGGDVYTLDMDLNPPVWTRHSALGSSAPTAPPVQGTFGRFRYSENKNVFIVVNDVDENVWAYRLSSAGVPPPASPLPGRTRRLRVR
jgi:hypothetical protein